MITDEHVQLFFDRFVMRHDCYNRQSVRYNPQKFKMELQVPLVYEPPTCELVRQHLEGQVTLAFPAFDETGMCKCPVWDCDNDQDWLDRIERVLIAAGFCVIRYGRRPGRAGHLRLLLDKPITAVAAMRFDKEIRLHAKVPADALEFFPKQASARKAGNAIRAPLGIHRKPGAGNLRAWFEGPPQDLNQQLDWLAAQPLNSADKIMVIVRSLEQHDAELAKYTRKKIRIQQDDQPDNEELLADLDPDDQGDYFLCDCPGCGEHEAYFYKDSTWITCNRKDKCKFSMSIDRYLSQHQQGVL
jgi:hypothetical protein